MPPLPATASLRLPQRYLRWSLVAAAVLVPLILLVLTVLVSRGFDEVAALRRESARSYEFRAELARILSLHQDLETGQRGYLISGDARFLEPYVAAAAEIEASFATLDNQLLRDPAIHHSFEALQRVSTAKRQFVDRTIALTRRGDAAQARALVAAGEGKRQMDIIRALIGEIAAYERTQLERRTSTADAARTRVRNRVIALQVLLLLLLAGASLLVVRSYAARNAALRRAQNLSARQEAIFDSAQDGMIVLNPSGSIESLNRAAAAMFGYTADDLLRRDVGLLFEIAPDRGRVESFLRRLEAHRRASPGAVQEFVGRCSDGRTIPVEVSISQVTGSGPALFVAVIRDISERREIEQMKGEFVATVSHELRTPLTSIAGSLGLLSGGVAGELPAKALRLVQIAHSNSTRLVRLINDILDIEKIEAGRMAFSIQPVPLDRILEQAAQDNAGFAGEYDVSVEVLPPPAGAAVLADPDRLMQVLTNLLSNAIKYSPRGERVTVAVTPLDRRYRISVIDKGAGIPEAFRERIFTKFAQADSSDTRQKGGTGLGLSIVRELVVRMGGSASFESAEGRGTTFHVDLPAAHEAAPPMTAEASPAEPDGSALPIILHVDDDPDMLRVVAAAFEGQARLHSTQSVIEARGMIRRTAFTAAILDIGMIDGCGLDLVEPLRRKSPEVPVVVFTAQDVETRRLESADLVLVKSRASLETLVEAVLRAAREAQAKEEQ